MGLGKLNWMDCPGDVDALTELTGKQMLALQWVKFMQVHISWVEKWGILAYASNPSA